MGTLSSFGRTGCEASPSSVLLAIPAQPGDAGTGMRPNDGARLRHPVLHAVESRLDPLTEDVRALGTVRVHRTRMDARAGRNTLLDELLQPLHAALAGADLVDEDAIAVLHLDDGLDRKERAERRLRTRDPATTTQILERVDQREDLHLSRQAAGHGDRIVEAPAVAQDPGARGGYERYAPGGGPRIDDLDLRPIDLLGGCFRDGVRDRSLVDDGDDEDRTESLIDERAVDLDAFAERWRGGRGWLLRRRELLVVLGGRHVHAGREILIAEQDVDRQQAKAELAL